MKIFKIFCVIIIFSLTVQAQEIINLYPGAVPNSKQSDVQEKENKGMFSGVTIPTLQIFQPEKNNSNGAAVIICPGGGYAVVVYQAEGVKTAKEFARQGVTAFVLKYRLPNDKTMLDKTIGPLQDAQQAIKTVRDNAGKWGIDVNKIGIMGFSAGGHLASTAATHFETAFIENDPNTNLRPDFQILVYPVISMQDSLTHPGSRKNLLGDNPLKEIVDKFSNELQVTANTPPAYITHSGDDTVVDVDNSIMYYEQLRHQDVPVEMHIYPKGNHGFVLFQPTEEWMIPVFKWMRNSGWITD